MKVHWLFDTIKQDIREFDEDNCDNHDRADYRLMNEWIEALGVYVSGKDFLDLELEPIRFGQDDKPPTNSFLLIDRGIIDHHDFLWFNAHRVAEENPSSILIIVSQIGVTDKPYPGPSTPFNLIHSQTSLYNWREKLKDLISAWSEPEKPRDFSTYTPLFEEEKPSTITTRFPMKTMEDLKYENPGFYWLYKLDGTMTGAEMVLHNKPFLFLIGKSNKHGIPFLSKQYAGYAKAEHPVMTKHQ